MSGEFVGAGVGFCCVIAADCCQVTTAYRTAGLGLQLLLPEWRMATEIGIRGAV
jgi:hypothetical protein